MYSDVCQYTASCITCQQLKRPIHPPKAPLHPLPIETIFGRWHCDALGYLPKSKEGYKYIPLCVESLTRWPEIHPVKTLEAEEIADVLFNQVFTRFSPPASLLSDRATSFIGKAVTSLCQAFRVKRLKTSSYHSQINSACEQFNRNILMQPKAHCTNQADWPSHLSAIAMAYRATICTSSTEYSPYFFMFGRQFPFPIDFEFGTADCQTLITQTHYIKKLLPKLEIAREIAQENVKTHQERYKQTCDKNQKTGNILTRYIRLALFAESTERCLKKDVP